MPCFFLPNTYTHSHKVSIPIYLPVSLIVWVWKHSKQMKCDTKFAAHVYGAQKFFQASQ